MNFYLIGVDYKSAKIEVREKLLRQRQEITDFWQSRNQPFTILSTCNRFEIYSISVDVFEASRQRENFYERFPLWRSGYFLSGQISIFRHALRLVSGLQSQLKGETQILQQISFWIKSESFPEIFKKVWNQALVEAENIRNFSGLYNKKQNIAHLVFEDLSRKYPGVNSEVIIAGTGNIAKLFAQYKPKDLQLNFVSTKHRLKAKKLSEYCAGKVIAFDELIPKLLEADFLVTATISPHFILKKADISEIISKRSQPLYIYDLALPRVMEPEISGLKNIILQNLDDLSPLFERENLKIQEKLQKAEYLLEEIVQQYEKDIKIRHAAKPLSFAAS